MRNRSLAESLKRCALLFVAGMTLQLSLGPVPDGLFKFPIGLILALNYVYLLILCHHYDDRWKFVKSLSSRWNMVASFCCLSVLLLVFGLTRQDGNQSGLTGVLGFRDMRNSWIFGLFFTYFTTSLGLKAIRDISHGNNLAVAIFHVAVFCVFTAGIFGFSDKRKVRVVLETGRFQTTGVNYDGETEALPFGIGLRRFTLSEYSPKLYLADTKEGKLSKEYVSVETGTREAAIGEWSVRVSENIADAAYSPDDSSYTEMKHVGTMPAIYVEASGPDGGKAEGWVSCGSFIFPGASVRLNDSTALVMPKPEPKEFVSEISVDDNGKITDAKVSVNHPARYKSWKIYQKDYDSEKGRWSDTSVLECVRDPWAVVVDSCLWLILAACVIGLFFSVSKGPAKKEEDNK